MARIARVRRAQRAATKNRRLGDCRRRRVVIVGAGPTAAERAATLMQEHYVILTLSGEYDIAYRDALQAELQAVRESESLVVDLSGVTFFDSSCIGELLALHAARVAAGRPKLTVVQNELIVKRLFELLGLNLVFRTVDSIDEVLPPDQTAVIRQYASGGDHRTSLSSR